MLKTGHSMKNPARLAVKPCCSCFPRWLLLCPTHDQHSSGSEHVFWQCLAIWVRNSSITVTAAALLLLSIMPGQSMWYPTG